MLSLRALETSWHSPRVNKFLVSTLSPSISHAMIPITIVTGFLGSGKTTLILNLIPQLPKDYRLALLKNEFGDLAIDSQLASSAAISGVKELLNGCICCNLVGQLGDALDTLRNDVKPDRIIIETSGSEFPATLALEVNRLGKESGNYVLDGVIVVIDVENWKGYDDTSYTAKMQARYTDLIIFNKWELVDERRYDECLDRVGDLELQTATVKSDKGSVPYGLLLGLDSALARKMDTPDDGVPHEHGHDDHHDHNSDHQSEVEVLSIAIMPTAKKVQSVDLDALETFLLSAPKDEIYRIKAIIMASSSPTSSDGSAAYPEHEKGKILRYILNWAFGRWSFTPVKSADETTSLPMPDDAEGQKVEPTLRMTVITARDESQKWKKRIITNGLIKIEGNMSDVDIYIQKIS